jgi:hypothetical protein
VLEKAAEDDVRACWLAHSQSHSSPSCCCAQRKTIQLIDTEAINGKATGEKGSVGAAGAVRVLCRFAVVILLLLSVLLSGHGAAASGLSQNALPAPIPHAGAGDTNQRALSATASVHVAQPSSWRRC